MKKYGIIFQCLMSLLFIHQQLQSQSYSAANWAWGKNFNSSATQPPKMCCDNGFVYTAGEYDSTLHIETQTFSNNGGSDIYLAKWDTIGNLIWAKTISQTDHQSVSNIHVKDNKIVLTGTYNSSSLQVGSFSITNNGLYDIFIANFDTNGSPTALYNYGTVGNDYIRSSCIDKYFNVYVAGDSLYKFSAIGIKQWNKNFKANHVYYSNMDSSVVADATGPSSIYTSGSNGFTYYYNDIITQKFNLQGDSIWRTNLTITNGHYSNPTYPGTYISDFNQDNDCLYIGYSNHFHISLINNAIVYAVSPNGTSNLIYNYQDTYSLQLPTLSNLSTNKHYLMLTMLDGYYGSTINTRIINLNTNSTFKIFSNYVPRKSNSYEFVDTNLIFAHGDNGIAEHTFGKFGKDTLQVLGDSVIHFCLGSTASIYPTIAGGIAPFSYSWLPTAGLNSTSTLSTSFTATTITTYTLTVTDANNITFSKAFHVLIDTPLSFTITAQYPLLCDSMQLYSNTGRIGNWFKYDSINTSYLGQGENFTIHSIGDYFFQVANSCGFNKDSINITGVNSFSNINISLCSNQVPYNWNGQNLTSSGVYYDTLTNSYGCDSIAMLHLAINPAPQPVVTFINHQLICTNVNNVNYDWYMNGQSLGINSDTLNLTQNGWYWVITTDSSGCMGIDSIQVINLSSEIIRQKIDDVSLYPNPTSQSISIDYTLKKESNVNIKIMDVVGNMITNLQKKNQASGHYSENIDLSRYHLSNGVYLIQLSNGVTNWNLPFVFRQ